MKQETMTQEQVRQLLGKPREPATSLDRPKQSRHKRAAEVVAMEDPRCLHCITLSVDLKNDNEGRSQNWRKAHGRKRQFQEFLGIGSHIRTTPFPRGVTVIVTRILGPRQHLFDPDSIGRGSLKELIDSLVWAGFFDDDGPRHIARVICEQDASRRAEGPAVEIRILTPESGK